MSRHGRGVMPAERAGTTWRDAGTNMQKRYIAVAIVILSVLVAAVLTLRGESDLNRFDREMGAILDEALRDWTAVADQHAPGDAAVAKIPGYIARLKALPKTDSHYRNALAGQIPKDIEPVPNLWAMKGAKIAPDIKGYFEKQRKRIKEGVDDTYFAPPK